MKNTTRKLHKAKKRSVRKGIRRYNLHQHAWCDETFELVPFTGKVDKNNQADRNALWNALHEVFGPSSQSNYPFGSSSWSIARIFTFNNSGVVVISHSISIGD